MKKGTNLLLAFSGIVLALSLFSCKKPADAKGAQTDSVQVTEVENVRVQPVATQTINRKTDFSTTLEANEQVNLVPNAPGKINKISVEVGSRVAKGAILVEMDQTILRQARVQMANLKTELNRSQILLQSGSISQQAYDQVKAQYDVADANVDNLEKNTYIRAPFSGIVSGKYFESGEMYSGAPTTASGKAAIVTLVQLNPLKAMVNISEAYYLTIKQGKTVVVSSEVFPSKKLSAKITRVYPTIDPNSHTFQVEISVPNAGEQLKPGMYCNVSLDMGQVEALMIPSQAVLKTQGSNERYVFVNEDGKAKRIKVLLGQRVDDQVEVISEELKVGDLLIVDGQGRLENGSKLKVVK